jgi:hypothetical protein
MINGQSLLTNYPSVSAKELFNYAPAPFADIAISPTKDPATAKAALLSILRQVLWGKGGRKSAGRGAGPLALRLRGWASDARRRPAAAPAL